VSVRIHTLGGQLLLDKKVSGNLLDISMLEAGLYIMEFSFEGYRVTEKLLVE
jgi:hypothetical protein